MKGVRGAHKKHKEDRQKEGAKLIEEDEEGTDGSDDRAPAETSEATIASSFAQKMMETPMAGPGLGVDRSGSSSGTTNAVDVEASKSNDGVTSDGSLKSASPLNMAEGEFAILTGLKMPSPSIDRHASLLHRHPHAPGPRGWSTMLDGVF